MVRFRNTSGTAPNSAGSLLSSLSRVSPSFSTRLSSCPCCIFSHLALSHSVLSVESAMSSLALEGPDERLGPAKKRRVFVKESRSYPFVARWETRGDGGPSDFFPLSRSSVRVQLEGNGNSCTARKQRGECIFSCLECLYRRIRIFRGHLHPVAMF